MMRDVTLTLHKRRLALVTISRPYLNQSMKRDKHARLILSSGVLHLHISTQATHQEFSCLREGLLLCLCDYVYFMIAVGVSTECDVVGVQDNGNANVSNQFKRVNIRLTIKRFSSACYDRLRVISSECKCFIKRNASFDMQRVRTSGRMIVWMR